MFQPFGKNKTAAVHELAVMWPHVLINMLCRSEQESEENHRALVLKSIELLQTVTDSG